MLATVRVFATSYKVITATICNCLNATCNANMPHKFIAVTFLLTICDLLFFRIFFLLVLSFLCFTCIFVVTTVAFVAQMVFGARGKRVNGFHLIDAVAYTYHYNDLPLPSQIVVVIFIVVVVVAQLPAGRFGCQRQSLVASMPFAHVKPNTFYDH